MGERPCTTFIQSAEEAMISADPESEKVCVVSQTTFNYNKFKDLVEILLKKSYDNNVF